MSELARAGRPDGRIDQGDPYPPNLESSLEIAIFVIGHEDWHVRNPQPGKYKPEDQAKEWEANASGRRFLERWRNRVRP